MLGRHNLMGGVSRIFSISPSVSGKSTWNLDVDGPLTLSTAGTWTIVPVGTFSASAIEWGAGGVNSSYPPGTAGAGGCAEGIVTFIAGTSYTLIVGATGTNRTGGLPGGGNAASASVGTGGAGGGYSIIKLTTGGTPILMAGGGGGGGWGYKGGAGGGSVGQAAELGTPTGGTQSAGGSVSGGFPGSALQGGNGQASEAYDTDSLSSGAGGGGWYGGGGGKATGLGDQSATGGSGGSSYYNPTYVVSATLTAGSYVTAGNSSSSYRGSAGNPQTAGLIRLA